jgi:prepilin-type N-terminal cleavage/methylation domain-containing protein
MRQYNGELGSKGFSLVELIIGMAVLLTTSLGFMMLLTEMSGTVASLENRSNTDTVFQRVRMYLTNEAVCTRTFVQLSDKTNGLSSLNAPIIPV